jgi:hypothetical protein
MFQPVCNLQPAACLQRMACVYIKLIIAAHTRWYDKPKLLIFEKSTASPPVENWRKVAAKRKNMSSPERNGDPGVIFCFVPLSEYR